MIKYCPRWVIFEDRGLYWVCKKPGGGMTSGRTIQEAKDKYKKQEQAIERYPQTFDEFLNTLDWGDE